MGLPARTARPGRVLAMVQRGLRGETFLSTSVSRLALAALFGAGTLSAALPARAVDVANEAQLRSAISSGQNTITFTANIALTANLPPVAHNVAINGGNFTLSGNGQFRGLVVQSGTVAVDDLTITKAKAQGGNGGAGSGAGGGGAGLGGALFVANGANVTLANVKFQENQASGGTGGDGRSPADFVAGGGGGMFGNGQDGGRFISGSGGAGGGGDGGNGGGANGGFGGGGGGAYGPLTAVAGNGGFGGGGGSGVNFTGRIGGFGGGNGGEGPSNGGGGGAGMGGAIFVQQGGNLTINGAIDVSQNTVLGGDHGAGGGPSHPSEAGRGIGSGIFLNGSGSFTVAPGVGQTQTISDVIIDQTGAGGTGTNAGSWSLVKNGAGTTILTGENAYTGGTTVNGGILQGTTTSLKGNITNNTQVVFDQSTNGTYAGVMSGNGGLFKRGTSEITLTGTNTYTNGTRIEQGTLRIAADNNLGAAATHVHLLNGGTLLASETFTSARPIGLMGGNGVVAADNLKILTLSGVVSGPGMLVKSGAGEVVLSGTNTYSGGTTVNGGVLRFTNDTNLGPSSVITLNGGSIGTTNDTAAGTAFTRSLTVTGRAGIEVAQHPITWSGNISGAGEFTKGGAGELELTGTNTYTGGTSIRQGTLRVASDDKLGAAGARIDFTNNGGLRASETFSTSRSVNLFLAGGTFLVDGGKTLTLAGVVSGTSLLKVGEGTMILAGANTYTGTTQVFQGILQGNATTVRGNIAFDESPLSKWMVFDQATDGTFAGNIAGVGITHGNGSVVKNGAGKLTLTGTSKYTGGTTVNAGALQGTSNSLQGNILNNATIIFDQATNGTYAGAMAGTGNLFKNGTGKLSLTGTSSVGGGTTINTGGFAVNGHLTSNVTLNKGGVLSGVGNITGNITNNGGTIEPGNSIGNITINGNLTWNSGTFDVEVSPSGASDRITIVGAGHKVTVHAGTLQVIPEPGTYVPNTKYTILTAPAGGIATFNDITGGVGFLTPALSFDDTNLYLSLVLAPNAFRSAGQTINQQAVGGALDAMAASGYVGGVVTTMANLSTAQGAPALQALSSEPYADFGTVNIRSSQLFSNAVGRQMAVDRGAAVGPKGVALAEACDVACDETAPPRLSAWLSGIGSTGSVLGDGNASGLTYTLGGTAFGIDYRLDPRFLIGIAGGYVGGSQWVNGFGGNGYTDALSVALYGSFTQNASGGGFYADALAGYANSNNRLQRVIAFPGQSAAVANGQTSANQFLGQIETGYKFGLPFPANTSISPFGRLQVGTASQAAFTESGTSPFNLSVAQQTTTSVRTTFGADFAASFDMGGGRPLDIGLRLGWLHEFADTARPITAAFAAAPVSQFTVLGATPQRDSAVVGFSAAAAITDRASLFASYDGEMGGGTDNHALRVGFRLTW